MRTSAVIERVKLILSSGRDASAEDGISIAEQYAGLVHSANLRLSECSGLLKAGMLSEALRKAETFPPLLELSAELDIPEAGAWVEACRGRRWVVPERIDTASVAAVTEAYSSQDAAEPLLRAFRKAALKQNLKQCVFLLRKLISLDPMREDWPRDLAAFEAKRLEQIALQAKLADERGNEAVLGLLLIELNEEWMDPEAKVLRQTVKHALDKLQLREVEAKADAIADSIVKSYNSLNLDAVEKDFAALADLAKDRGLRISSDRNNKTRDAHAWLQEAKEQLRRDTHHREILGMIDLSLDKQDAHACHAAYAELTRNEYAIDEPMQKRVSQLFEMQKRIDRQRHKRKVALIAAALAVLAVGLIIGLLQLKYKIAKENLIANLQQCIQEENTKKAEDILSNALQKHKKLAKDAGVLESLDKIKIIKKREQEAAHTFASALAALRDMEATGYSGREEEAAEQIRIADASMPKGIADQNYLSLVEKYEKHVINRTNEADDATLVLVKPLRDMLSKLQKEGDRKTHTDKLLEELRVGLQAGFPKLEWSSETTKTIVEALSAETTAFATALASQRQQLQSLAQSKSLEEYLTIAKAFVLAFPSAVEAVALTKFLELEPSYRAYTSRDLEGELMYGTSRKFLAGMNDKWLDVKEAITGLERDKRMTMLAIGFDSDGKIFFWESWPTAQRMPTGMMGIGGMAYLPRPTDTEPNFESLTVSKTDVKTQVSPHCELVRELIAQCRIVPNGGEGFSVLIAYLNKIATKEEIDPLLRLRLASYLAGRIRDMMPAGSSQQFELLSQDLSAIDPEVSWLCVASEGTKAGNIKAKSILGRHFSKTPTTPDILAFELAIKSAIALRGMTFAGLGVENGDGEIKSLMNDSVNECFVLRKDNEGNPVVLLVAERRENELKRYITPGKYEPVFVPTDGKTVWSLLNGSRQAAKGAKLPIPLDCRAWPINVKI